MDNMHNCFVVLADMGGMVTDDEGSTGAEGRSGPGAHGARAGAPPGSSHESRIPFPFGREGSPLVFGTFIHPSQDMDVLGGPGGEQPGPGDPPPLPPALFNMGQSLLFRMAGPPPSAGTSTTASHRRSAAPTASAPVCSGNSARPMRARLARSVQL
jgi:hypothetical protein